MAKDDHIFIKGTVVRVLGGTQFEILADSPKEKVKGEEVKDSFIIAGISGKIRQNKIRILLSDHVEVAVSPYDLKRGIIQKRL